MTDLPDLRVVTGDPLSQSTDALIAGVFEGGIEAPGTREVLLALGYDDVPSLAGFTGKEGQTAVLAAPELRAGRVMLVGLGPLDGLGPEALRRASGSATRALATEARSIVSLLALVDPSAATARAVAEGALLGAYRFTQLKSDPTATRLERVTIALPASLRGAGNRAIHQATVHARAGALARDLVNLPPDRKQPADLAALAVKALEGHCEVEVWDEKKLKRRGYGGLIAVGQGSSAPPRLLIATHRPEHSLGHVVLVGKGITYDSGGLSLKRPNEHLATMKMDMGGAAAVIATMAALHDLDVHLTVTGIAALAENMPDGNATRPGDVITIADGTTVEVLNTDAEGRLVLADALTHAVGLKPDAIVDLATLTGAVAYAVGNWATGIMGTDDDLLRQLLGASEDAGERTWQLPLWDELRPHLDSDVADLNNLGRGNRAGSTMAGMFLREFTGGIPWAHLDIAASAWADKPRGYHTIGGTGTGARTLLRWLESASANVD